MQNIAELQDHNTINTKNIKILNTKFGQLTVNLDKKIILPEGIIGLPQYNEYVVSSFPNSVNNDSLKILQSLQEDALTFVILPLNCDENKLFSEMIEEEDIIKICNILQFDYGQLVVALILNIEKKIDDQFEIYANVKAPLLIDTKKMQARQYILAKNKYQVRKKL